MAGLEKLFSNHGIVYSNGLRTTDFYCPKAYNHCTTIFAMSGRKTLHFRGQKRPSEKNKKCAKPCNHAGLTHFSLAGAEGLEPSARGFGDRCSTN